jgi:hypothetical protein
MKKTTKRPSMNRIRSKGRAVWSVDWDSGGPGAGAGGETLYGLDGLFWNPSDEGGLFAEVHGLDGRLLPAIGRTRASASFCSIRHGVPNTSRPPRRCASIRPSPASAHIQPSIPDRQWERLRDLGPGFRALEHSAYGSLCSANARTPCRVVRPLDLLMHALTVPRRA